MTMPAMLIAGRASALPLALLSQAIPHLSRHDLEDLTERLIDRLDQIDGDPDYENASDLEDDFALNLRGPAGAIDGPGCECSDTGEHNGDFEPEETDDDRVPDIPVPDTITVRH